MPRESSDILIVFNQHGTYDLDLYHWIVIDRQLRSFSIFFVWWGGRESGVYPIVLWFPIRGIFGCTPYFLLG